MSELRIIPVVFGGKHFIITDHRMQYDYGQVLDFKDLELPDSFEARFSNSPVGESVGQIGTNNRIRIPKQFFESGEPIYCYITLHDEVTDGRTVYTTKVPIKPSSERTEEEPEPEEESIITQAISALNTAVEKTAQDVASADALVQAASEQADRAEHAAEGVEGYAERAEAAQSASENAKDRAVEAETSARTSAATASEKASEAISSATTASQSAMTAENASESAQEYATASAESASQASQSADTASGKASDASGYASNASTSAQTASQKASEAAQSASTAVQAKTDAESAKTASQTAQGLAESARDNAITAKTGAEDARDEAQDIVDGITGKVEQIDSNTEKIESLEDDRYKPYVVDTASGSIASFADGADDIPLKSCIVRVEPVQDLHGYDSPWPAGGGKNVVDFASKFTEGETVTQNGVTATYSKGYLRVTGTNTGSTFNIVYKNVNITLPAGTYIMPSNLNIRANIDGAGNNNYDSSFSAETSVVIGAFYVFAGTSATVDYNIPIMLVKGTTRPTVYSPYSNICPISGWTEIGVEQRGINVWDEEWELGYINPSNGNNASSSNCIRAKNYIPVKPNTTYYVVCPNVSRVNVKIATYDADKGFIFPLKTRANGTVTTSSDCHYIRFFMSDPYGTTYNHDISINYPSTDHDYHPYSGRTYPITFPTEAGTVYGGTLDVTSGVLTFSHAIVKFGNWMKGIIATYSSKNGYYYNGANLTPPMASGSFYLDQNTICSHFAKKPNIDSGMGIWVGANNTYFYFAHVTDNIPNIETSAKFCEWLEANDVFMTYPLATPITYTLTPTEIKTLLGQNNVWADTGDVSVEYRADVKLYINKKIAEAISALS